mmetsp:Transcript_41503/g.50300  ORF Transcript_41503/g.50300 Transcript_41503/m.50300 type:complete len:136 (-) Transcript_41503:254-661(-)|eukprot:CAMPEP_0197852540 /NCGR_PEP_ID=MMETSP1438-20131217/20854_1 /TAXON_ID=1461541 /ORGANISM="Pterosperma sp., Strain CCMP1384" /LENGTH=135 /DNA_ID=CAMNT_0043466635 /DNA_START=138 /DNA_END=545 /DNA_ORIENTATION=+
MSNPKTVEVLNRYKGPSQVTVGKAHSGTHHEITPKYPSMYKRSMPGDIGWNVHQNEHTWAKDNGKEEFSAIAEKRHNREDGMALKETHLQVKHRFMKLPGKHTGDALLQSSMLRTATLPASQTRSSSISSASPGS